MWRRVATAIPKDERIPLSIQKGCVVLSSEQYRLMKSEGMNPKQMYGDVPLVILR